MMKKSFVCYSDPAHGWAKVPEGVIAEIGMKAADFSQFSYLDRGHIFLEEDCDLSAFVEGFRKAVGEDPVFKGKHCNGRSKIRSKYPNNQECAEYFVPSIAG